MPPRKALPSLRKTAVTKPVSGGGPPVAIDSVYAELALGESLISVPVDRVKPNPHQPRKHFPDESLAALSASIAERGLIQPIVVRALEDDWYELVAGERRWRASQLAGRTEIPAIRRDLDPQGSALDALAENVHREDLNPVDEARAYAALVEGHGMTREQVGTHMGKSRSAISNSLRLLDLPDEALDLLATGTLTARHGRALLITSDHTTRRKLARKAAADGMTVAQLEAAASATEAGRATKRPKAPVISPDHEASATAAADTLSQTTGAQVAVRPRGPAGFQVRIDLPDQAALDQLVAATRPRKRR